MAAGRGTTRACSSGSGRPSRDSWPMPHRRQTEGGERPKKGLRAVGLLHPLRRRGRVEIELRDAPLLHNRNFLVLLIGVRVPDIKNTDRLSSGQPG